MTPTILPSAAILAAGLTLAAPSALACTARPPSGAFSGPILNVPQAGVVCVALGATPDQWVRVRLLDGSDLAPRRLMAAGFGKRVECQASGAWGRCRFAGEDLVATARSPAVEATAVDWRAAKH